jgi:hypothetical protein
MERLTMKTPSVRTVARAGFHFTLPVFAILVCSAQPSIARGTCGPTEQPNGIGICQECPGIFTLASISSAEIGFILTFNVQIQNAVYLIKSNVGTFDISNTQLPKFNFQAPPPAPVPLKPVNGSNSLPPFAYTATPSIPNTLKLSFKPWEGGNSGITVPATLDGDINIQISAVIDFVPISVNPTLSLTGLPVTITFGADGSGDATTSPSQVVVAPIGSFGSVSGCGAFGWCNGLASGAIYSGIQSQLQSVIASQFASALNGQNNSSPFWVNFMNAVANIDASQLIDAAGNPLPKVNQATPGGTTTSWSAIGQYSYAGGNMTAYFNSSGGLCYIDCTPKGSQAALCKGKCGNLDDGCGDTYVCPVQCIPQQQFCNSSNQCESCPPLTCANFPGMCGPFSNACGAVIACNICGAGTTCDNGHCVGFGGQGGLFCQNCRKTGGVCSPGPGGHEVCIHQ